MRGTMMDLPLTVSILADRPARYFADVEIVSRQPDRALHRTTWGPVIERARSLAGALLRAGLRRGDRVATLMWNHAPHLETYFGELGLFMNEPRSASVVALEPTEVMVMSRPLAATLGRDYPAVLKTARQFVRDRLIATVLKTSPVFASSNGAARQALVALLNRAIAKRAVRIASRASDRATCIDGS